MKSNFMSVMGTLLFVFAIDILVVIFGGESIGADSICLITVIVALIRIMDKIDEKSEG